MTDRALLARAILSEELNPSITELRDRHDEEWLAAFPGGVATFNTKPDGLVLNVSIERIVTHGQHLSDNDFTRFCRAIRSWQDDSTLDVMLLLAPDLVVAMFEQDHPADYKILAAVAGRAGIPVIQFLGATSPEERRKWHDDEDEREA